MRNIQLCIPLLLIGSITASCSKDSSKSAPAPTEQFKCAKNNSASLTSGNCPELTELQLSGSFFSESRKVLKLRDGHLILRSVAELDLLDVQSFAKTGDVLNGERGTLTFVKNNNIEWQIRNKDFNIYDFDIDDKNNIIAIAGSWNKNTLEAKILFIQEDGFIQSVQNISDSEQSDDICINFDNEFIYGLCQPKEDNSVAPLLIFPEEYYYIYPMAKIAWSKANNNFYLLMDRGIREVTMLYKFKFSKDFFTQLNWKQQILSGTKSAYYRYMDLNSGEERYAINRFGRFMEKILIVDSTDNALVSFNIEAVPKHILTPKVSQEEHLQNLKNNGTFSFYIYKYNKSGAYLWHTSRKISDSSAPVTALQIFENSIFSISHTYDKDGKYRISIQSTSLDDGQLLHQSPEIGIIPINSFAIGLHVLNANEVLLSGLTGFDQNPHGMSIDSGKSFISKYNLNTQNISSFILKKTQRKEIISNILVENNILQFILDFNGPTTHSLDNDTTQGYQKSSLIKVNLYDLF